MQPHEGNRWVKRSVTIPWPAIEKHNAKGSAPALFAPDHVDMSRYTDPDTVSTWVRDAFLWAKQEGIVDGTTATTLSPQNTATHAEVAAELHPTTAQTAE